MSIKVNDLSFQYSNRKVLKNISFAANSGDLLCVLGPNGVGKSTLFKCILGLLHRYEGEILVEEKDIKKISKKQMAREIAYIPQSHFPTFNFTVINTVLMGMTAQLGMVSSPKLKDEEEVMSILEDLGIAHLAYRGYGEVSGGERQLVLIARAMAQKAKVLVMDEPTANLDYGNQVRVMEKVKDLARKGYTIILSTHNPDHALLYGNKVMVIFDGQVIKYGNPNSELSSELFEKIYGVKVHIKDVEVDRESVRLCVPKLKM